jgi:NAD(P)-dependent dehydrogenase (short-subunit alcohol dehydrogenase family)
VAELIGSTGFVTGGGQGVGEAIARRLVAAGLRQITIAARRINALERMADELRAAGAEVLTQQLDLESIASIKEAANAAQERFGPVDILINSAGATDRGDLFTTTPQSFDRLFNTNVRGNFFLMQELGKAMTERRSGVVINISSMLAHGGLPHLLPYSASKAALNLITKNVANSLRYNRVRVHAINLGWTVTPAENKTQIEVHGMPEDWAEKEGARQPFGRLLNADDPAALAVFLASRDAEMMTGTIIDMEQWVSGVINAE